VTAVVLLSHPSARIEVLERPGVLVKRSVSKLVSFIEGSQGALDAGRRADIERLVRRDHAFSRGEEGAVMSSGANGRTARVDGFRYRVRWFGVSAGVLALAVVAGCSSRPSSPAPRVSSATASAAAGTGADFCLGEARRWGRSFGIVRLP
jgi:hypothetical protein